MNILLAIEGSDFSKAAIDYCCKVLGNSDRNEIRIVSAMERMLPPTEPFAVSAEYVQKIDNQTQAETEANIASALAEIQNRRPGLAKHLSTKLLIGPPEQAIVEEAESWGADLIILGSHGYGFWKRAMMGSVSNAVLHHAPCSVLIVRSPETTAAQAVE